MFDLKYLKFILKLYNDIMNPSTSSFLSKEQLISHHIDPKNLIFSNRDYNKNKQHYNDNNNNNIYIYMYHYIKYFNN